MAGLDPSSPGRPKAKYNAGLRGSGPSSRRSASQLDRTRGSYLIGWAGRPACSIDLGFLGPSWICPGVPENKGRISLDFLGFSRQNLDFSMGYADFWRKKISRALLLLKRRARRQERYSYDTETQSGHRPSLTFFCFSARSCRLFVELRDRRFRGLSVMSGTSLHPNSTGSR
jgi:hypothetical protein